MRPKKYSQLTWEIYNKDSRPKPRRRSFKVVKNGRCQRGTGIDTHIRNKFVSKVSLSRFIRLYNIIAYILQ